MVWCNCLVSRREQATYLFLQSSQLFVEISFRDGVLFCSKVTRLTTMAHTTSSVSLSKYTFKGNISFSRVSFAYARINTLSLFQNTLNLETCHTPRHTASPSIQTICIFITIYRLSSNVITKLFSKQFKLSNVIM